MFPAWSATCCTQPAITSSINTGSMPTRVIRASSTPARRSTGCTSDSAPPGLPFPTGLRTASTMTALFMAGPSVGDVVYGLARSSRRHPDGSVEAERLTVEVAVLQNLARERGVLVGLAEPLRVRDAC